MGHLINRRTRELSKEEKKKRARNELGRIAGEVRKIAK